ncbi:MAG: DUF21 domain-containing protein [Alistipes sp.]|nr:DUF21 domain-containing protein [Alistipes sp.]
MAETPWMVFNGFEGSVVSMMLFTLLLLCVSAFVSGSETAFFSLSHRDLQDLEKRDAETANRVVSLLSNVDLLLATILVVNNLVNIAITILTASIIDSLFTFYRFDFLFKTVLVTFLLLLFGEVLPKVFAQTSPARFASFAARPIQLLQSLFRPLSMILVRTGNRISERAPLRREISLDEFILRSETTKNLLQ